MRETICISQDETLRTALEFMIKERVNSITVVDESGAFVGTLNSADVIRAALPKYMADDVFAAKMADMSIITDDIKRVADRPLKDFMNTDAPAVKHDEGIVGATVIASGDRYGRITIVDDDNKPIGVLTRTELKQVVGSFLDIHAPPYTYKTS